MDSESVTRLLRDSGAVLEGHFVLSSGRHSDTYVECARVVQHPERAGALAEAIVGRLSGARVDAVIGAALGSVVLGYEVARRLGVRAMFTERPGGVMMLRRGFVIARGERLLLVEDVMTTGASSREVIDIVRSQGAEVVGAAFVVDRSGGEEIGVPRHALVEMTLAAWEADRCPLCEAGTAAVKPGGAQRKGF